MKLRKLMLACGMTSVIMGALAVVSTAATLATFQPATANQYSYVYTNPTAFVPDATVSVVNAPVTFNWGIPGLPINIPGIMNMTSTVDPNINFGQLISNITGNSQGMVINSMSIRSTAAFMVGTTLFPVNTLLLSMTAFEDPSFPGPFQPAGFLTGAGSIGSHNGSTDTGALIQFQSTVVPSVAASLFNDYSFALSGATPPFTPDASFPFSAEFVSFRATMSGNFDYTPAVPEPGMLGMLLGAGVGGSMFGLRLRRRA